MRAEAKLVAIISLAVFSLFGYAIWITQADVTDEFEAVAADKSPVDGSAPTASGSTESEPLRTEASGATRPSSPSNDGTERPSADDSTTTTQPGVLVVDRDETTGSKPASASPAPVEPKTPRSGPVSPSSDGKPLTTTSPPIAKTPTSKATSTTPTSATPDAPAPGKGASATRSSAPKSAPASSSEVEVELEVESPEIGKPLSTAAPTTQPTIVPAPAAPASQSGSTVYRVTVGSGRSTALDTSSASAGEAAHGTRLYCPVSHFSHDDPVVFPGRVGAAHAHMFWGNTEADAFSTGPKLLASGNSSCEGGINNRSSYWMPTLMNSGGEVMLPEEVIVYYKSFGGPGFDRNTIQTIPVGLELLATKKVANAHESHFRVTKSGDGVELFISFPQCLQVSGADPVLSSGDNIAHLSYDSASDGTSNTCPRSHPYRIPQISYRVRYQVPFESAWYLSSDKSTATKGQSLHADYIAAWEPASMQALVDCNIKMKKECQFAGVDGGNKVLRGQLPERFNAPNNTPIYQHSVGLLAQTDRTPFGTSIGKMAG